MWLKKEFLASNAKFVYSKNELGYQEVLDKFESAKEINIITYNISEKNLKNYRLSNDFCARNTEMRDVSRKKLEVHK